MYGEFVKYEKDGEVGLVTLNRPDRLNALGQDVRRELNEVLDEIEVDATRVVIFAGEGRAFCAGADINDLSAGEDLRSPVPDPSETPEVIKRIGDLNKVVIAAVHGAAVGGGCEVALACDMRIASENARFGLPEIKLGIMPGAGGTQRMPRLVGEGRAKWLMMTGEFIDAQTSLQWGLVNQVVPNEELMAEARKLAQTLVAQPPLALAFIKSAVDRGLESSLPAGIEYEARCSYILQQTEDKAEGTKAFLEKRKPVFTGR
ncbi:MAG: enoyl-CoA hydratase [Chloroflexi bacterium]|nr:MAG: enoyl-CoA hydratase [Chloroflexota bacterium]